MTRRADLFHTFLVFSAAFINLVEIIQIITIPRSWSRWLLCMAFFNGVAMLVLTLNRRGKTSLAASLFLCISLAAILLFAWTAGGIQSSVLHVLPIFIFLAGVLLGWKKGFLIAGIEVLLISALLAAELSGFLPKSFVTYTPINHLTSAIGTIGMLVLLTYLATSSLDRSLREAREELEKRIRIGEELKKSEENLTVTLSSIGDAVIATDVAGFVTRMNPAAERLCGWTLAEAAGRPLTEVFRIINARTREIAVSPVEDVIARGAVMGLANHTTLLARDGTEYQIADSAAPIRNAEGLTIGVVLVFSDVTEKYRIEARLRESNELLSLFISRSPIYSFIKEVNAAESRVLHASENYEQMIGIKGSLMAGKTMAELFPPDLAAKMLLDDLDVVSKGKLLEVDEELNGRSYNSLKFPIVQDGKTLLAGFTMDVTERKRAENNLRQSLREKETLIRELFHRTKNTMQIIRGMIMLQAAEFPDNKELEKVVKMTEDRIQAISLVHQMLFKSQNLSHISTGDYIRELCPLLFRSFGIASKRIALELRIEEQEVLLDTAIPFGLILNELLTNSLKHGFPDEQRGIIAITLETLNAATMILHYSDTGIGVPGDFDFRTRNTLGLKLIYSIGEEQLQGKVEMDGKAGYRCTIEFPKNLYQARV